MTASPHPGRRAVRLLGVAVLVLSGLLPIADPIAAAGSSPTWVTDPAALVDPLIGTAGAVNDFPGADAPFGMVQWSPDTPSRPKGGGYWYHDDAVTGFSLDHLSGPGCAAAGDVPVLPTSGAVHGSPGAATLPLDHADESATAGEYHLAGGGITTDLTATTRSGMARFSFPAHAPANLLFKLSGSARLASGLRFHVVGPREVEGQVTSGRFCGAGSAYTFYFDMDFDTPFASSGTWTDGDHIRRGATSLHVAGVHSAGRTEPSASTADTRSSNGVVRHSPRLHGALPAGDTAGNAAPRSTTPQQTAASGAYVTFTHHAGPIRAKVGVSFVSVANARRNRRVENAGWNFGSTARHAAGAWNRVLNRVRIGGGTRTQQTIFETALYHSLLHPNVFSDSNGQYRGFDGRVHRAPRGRAEYANYSGWDTYRSQVQLEAMVAPHQTSDMVRSMLDDYAQTGQLPKWNFDGSETYVMVGDPADSIIADAYAFGARHFDTGEALTAMQAEANQPNDVRPGQAYDENDGYLPSDGGYGCCNFYGPVSTQLEYDTADHAIAAFAADLGRKGISSSFARRASNWQNVFDPASGYLEPKNADGRFASHVGPSSTAGFVEGTSAQYTPMVPFDVAGLAAAAGGDAAWVARLDSLTSHIRHPGPRQSDFGNEPSLEVPWEYDYVGAPYRAQRVVRRIERELYLPKPAGIAGNDDLGEMSSWYVFAALGFYPETPGTADLALGSALFPRAALHLPSGRTLTVDAPKAAIGSPYVHAMTVDGRTWRHAYLPASLVSSGGTVDETLSATPDPGFGATAADAPPSDGRGSASALGYSDKHVVTAAPGQTVTFAVGARNLQPAAQDVSWSASSDADLGLVPQSGTLALPAGGRRSATVSVTAPSTVGSHLVTVDLSPSAAGAAPPPVVIEVDVVASG